MVQKDRVQTDRVQKDSVQTDRVQSVQTHRVQTDRVQTDRVHTDRVQTDRVHTDLGLPTKAPGIAQDCPQRPQEQPRTAYKWSRSGPRLPTEGLTTSHPSISRQFSRKNTLTKRLTVNIAIDY